MRRYQRILLLMSTIVISGCTTKQETTFVDVIDNYHANTSIRTNTTRMRADFADMHGHIALTHDSDTFTLDGTLSQSGQINLATQDYMKTIQYDVTMHDHTMQQYVISSGEMQHIYAYDKPYWYINQSNINMGTGNAEAKLLNTITQSLHAQRIQTKQHQSMLHLLTNPANWLHLYQQLTTLNQQILTGNMIYKTGNNTWGQPYFVATFTGIDAAGTMQLLPNGKMITTDIQRDNLHINATVEEHNSTIGIYDNNLIITGTVMSDKIIIHVVDNNIPNTQLQLLITPKNNKDNALILDIYGTLGAAPFPRDIKETIDIHINGTYMLTPRPAVNIVPPQQYIILEQFLADEYALETLLQQK